MLGWIAFWYEWDWRKSESIFRHAIALNPYDAESHLGYAHLLANTGRLAQAIEEAQRARELSPFFTMITALEGMWLLRAGRVEEAQQQLERARDQDATFWHTRIALADIYRRQGRFDEAAKEAKLAREYSGDSTWGIINEVGALVEQGRTDEAEALRNSLLDRAKKRYVPPYDLACAAIVLGAMDDALAWLEKAFALRDPKMTFLAVDKIWEKLRSRPEFIDLLRRMKLLGVGE